MARTAITVQPLNTKGGQVVTFQGPDTTNNMQVRNTGREVVVVQAGTGSSVTIAIPSFADQYGRTGDITGVVVAANTIQAFGPFSPPTIWGDGSQQLWINPSAVSGSTGIAVISI